MRGKHVSKPGPYGTLYLYAVPYRGTELDPCEPERTVKLWAYDPEHAEDRFYDGPDEGWMITARPKRVRRRA